MGDVAFRGGSLRIESCRSAAKRTVA